MIHGPATIAIGNETNVTRDIIFRHCNPYSNIPRTINQSALTSPDVSKIHVMITASIKRKASHKAGSFVTADPS
jgi:hypothetical protein